MERLTRSLSFGVDFLQRAVVAGLHGLPRFGHPAAFAALVSTDRAERKEYTDGILCFGIVLSVLALVWAVVLVVLKYNLTARRVGCAAGGEVVDVAALREAKVNRAERRRRILRNWRVQVALLLLSLLIPTLSFLLVNHGLNPFYESLQYVRSLSEEARDRALQGIEVATDLVFAQNRIGSIVTSLQPEEVCPNYDDGTAAALRSYNATLQNGRIAMDAFVEEHVSRMTLGLSQVAHATLFAEDAVDSAQSYDWLVKGFLVALNAANVFWFVGVLLTRHNVYHPLYQQFLTWFAVPAFSAVLLGTVAATIVSSALAITNADFCSGGTSESHPLGSPQGTLQDVLAAKGFNATDLPYQALQYYSSNCNGTSPFTFLHNFKVQMQLQRYDLVDRMEDLLDKSLNLTARCGDDTLGEINVGMLKLQERLNGIEATLSSASNLTSCGAVQPLFQRLLNGSPCSDMPQGLAWLFGCSAALLAVGLAMLSVRAGLYNTVLKPRRIKRREREFREYKEYMSNYYQTGDWKMDPDTSDKKKDAGTTKELASTHTFDTEATGDTTSPSPRSVSGPTRSPSSVASAGDRSYVYAARSSVSSRRSRFRFVDPGVVYYSSDSDDASDDDDSEVDETSTISTLFKSVFLARRSGVAPGALSPSSSRKSVGSSSTTSRGYWFGPRPSPAPTTPAQRLRHLSDLRLEETEGGGAVVLAKESLELQALAPSPPPELSLPTRPHKKHKHRSRTVGGSLMEAT